MVNHVCTLHRFFFLSCSLFSIAYLLLRYQKQEITSQGGFAINFEKSWKGDVENFPCDIEAAAQGLPTCKMNEAVEAARLDGWGLFPTSKIQALETLSQDDDYMIRRTAIRILGQSAHLYAPILRKIIQVLIFWLSFLLLLSFSSSSPLHHSLPFSTPISKSKASLLILWALLVLAVLTSSLKFWFFSLSSFPSSSPFLFSDFLFLQSRCALLDANNPETPSGRGKTRVWQRLSSQWRLCVPGGRSHSPAK